MPSKKILPHTLLFVKPAAASLAIGFLWFFVFRRFGIHLTQSDESILTDAIIPILATFHAIAAGFVLQRVWDEYSILRRCVRRGDKKTFDDYKGERVPMAIHMLLAVMSLLVQGMVMILDYEDAAAGWTVTMSIAFMLTLYWLVATNLDDPFHGAWYIGEIPDHWLSEEGPQSREGEDDNAQRKAP